MKTDELLEHRKLIY